MCIRDRSDPSRHGRFLNVARATSSIAPPRPDSQPHSPGTTGATRVCESCLPSPSGTDSLFRPPHAARWLRPASRPRRGHRRGARRLQLRPAAGQATGGRRDRGRLTPVSAGRGGFPRSAGELAELHQHAAHAARGRVDEQGVARTRVRELEEREVRRARDEVRPLPHRQYNLGLLGD